MSEGQQGQGAFSAATGRGLENDGGKPRYLDYQRELIGAHCGRSVLEIGAGLGEFAEGFTGRDRYVITDVDPEAVRRVEVRFAGRPEVEARQFDVDGGDVLDDPVDSLLAINVLEHIEDDADALRSLAKSLRAGGNVILFVPGYMQLYGEFDRKVGHHRRYTPATLRHTCERAGLVVDVAKPVNFLGAFAWWAAVRKGGAGAPNPKLVGIYDRFVVPITRFVEKLVPVPFGQSVLCVARKPG
ncbi:class I SAM-dependent methyltransferase [Saccharopolyspora griseoalba]|uniref:Class I SAM-dependent methyltransferase n=1 Tax=Saccharopolyspora griseoalba TaxID=1431848 RepID=A0ABW2LFV1_9PSEU